MPEQNPLATTPAPATTPAAAPSAALSPADLDRVVAAIDAHTKTVQKTVGDWSQQVIRSGQPAPAPTPKPAADDDALTAIAADGWKPLDARVTGAVEKALKETLVPYLGAQANDAATAHEAAIRERVDKDFGAGSYDELFKSRVEELFGGETASKAIRGQWDRALALVKGEKFAELADKRAKASADRAAADKEAERVARNAPYMPGSGYRPTGHENTLSDDDRDQLKRVRAATGVAPSEEDAAKMRDLVATSRGGVSLDDFNRLFPIPAK